MPPLLPARALHLVRRSEAAALMGKPGPRREKRALPRKPLVPQKSVGCLKNSLISHSLTLIRGLAYCAPCGNGSFLPGGPVLALATKPGLLKGGREILRRGS